MILDVNGIQLVIEPKTVGSGVDIDELSEVLKSNTSFIYQKAAEKLLGRDYFNSFAHKLEEEYPYRLDD